MNTFVKCLYNESICAEGVFFYKNGPKHVQKYVANQSILRKINECAICLALLSFEDVIFHGCLHVYIKSVLPVGLENQYFLSRVLSF